VKNKLKSQVGDSAENCRIKIISMDIAERIQRILDKSPEQIQELIGVIGFDSFVNIFGRFDYSDFLLYPHFTKLEIVEYASRKSDLEKLSDESLSAEINKTEIALSRISERMGAQNHVRTYCRL